MKYYLHRISQHTEWSHPLLDEKQLLSIGWADYGASRDFLAQHEDKWSSVASTVERDYPKARPRFGLQRFLEMAQGDRVVVPTWGAFHVYTVTDNRRLAARHIENDLRDLQSWNGKSAIVTEEGYIEESDRPGDVLDLGFFRRVEPVVRDIPRDGYADAALTNRLKVRQTNVEISDLHESIDNAIDRYENKRPINLRTEVLETCAAEVRKTVLDSLNPDQFEQLIRGYLEEQGATAYIPGKNEQDKEGDADIVATFEPLKLIVYVQAKLHDGTTDGWAVQQIKEYTESKGGSGADDGYVRLSWVVSTAERFSDDCREAAERGQVRLIDGEEFARMLLDSGIKQL